MPPAEISWSAQVLRLVQVATLGALCAALAAEVGAAFAAQGSGLLRLFAPPAHALHPFLPVFIGLLLMPPLVAAIALVLGRVYRGPIAKVELLPMLAVAIHGAVPIYVAMLFVAVPFGTGVVGAGVLVSCVLWITAYHRLLGVPAGAGAQCFGLSVLAVFATLPMLGALLAILA